MPYVIGDSIREFDDLNISLIGLPGWVESENKFTSRLLRVPVVVG